MYASEIVVIGILSGIVMGLLLWALRAINFTRMNLINYEGSLITGRSHGASTFIAGILVHLIASAIIAFFYAWAFRTIFGHAGWKEGLIISIPLWIVAGLASPIFDRFNSAVHKGKIGALGFFASKYQLPGVIAFLAGHLLYGMTVGVLDQALMRSRSSNVSIEIEQRAAF
jgi:hypothetical protein